MRDENCTRGGAVSCGPRGIRRWEISLSQRLCATILCWCCGVVTGIPAGRNGNDTLRMPATANPFPYAVQNAFGDLTFTDPMVVVTPPGENNRIFVAEEGGTIVVIPDLNNPARHVFLDISDRISYGRPEDEGGLLGLAFHPNYAANGYFYVYYLCNTATADGTGRHNRLSRFSRSRTDPNRGDPSSELILFSQYDQKFNHNGGTVLFGPDGYLYLTLGDEGHPDDMFDNAQRIDRDFFSGVIRLDVDKRTANRAPNPHPALKGQVNYFVPRDNPWVGATSFNGRAVDPAKVRTEFWAVGLRSPWRMFWDVPTGNLYVSDVGEEGNRGNHSEEINLIVRGGNYGWPYFESLDPGPKHAEMPAGFQSISPLIGYERGDSGPTVGRAAIGGVVYRGSRFGELNGAYIFGDYFSGNIWKLRHAGNTVTEWQRVMAMSQWSLVSFGTDPRNGDVLICDVNADTVHRLVPAGPESQIPPTLADTGAFANLQALQPHAGIVPYNINVPFWSDGASKQRWFSIPDATAKIRGGRNGRWEFPEGSVFIKHFELELVKGDPNSRRRLETRFLVRSPEGVYGVTYRWNDAQNNATLVSEGGESANFTVNDNGVIRQQTWRFPARNECLACHTPVAGHVLGVNGPQMNRGNQIQALAQAGYFAGAPSLGRRLVNPASAGASLNARVRSYLAVNCAQCHQPGGTGRGVWDARFTTPTARAGIVNGGLNDTMGNPANRVVAPRAPEHSMLLQRMLTLDSGRRMPPLASSVVDTDAVNLVAQWINSLPKRTTPLRVRITSPAAATTSQQLLTIRGMATGENVTRVIYSLNDGVEQLAAGVSEWSADVILAPGENRITVVAENQTGERSRPLRKLLRYVDPR